MLAILRRWGVIAITVAALALAVVMIDWRALLAAANRLSLQAILACLALCLLTHLLIALRWSLIVAADAPRQGRVALGLREALTALHSQVFNLVTPGGLGADVHRVAGGAERRGGRAGSAGYVVLERLLGVAAQSGLFLLAFALAPPSGMQVASARIFALIAAGIVLAACATWIGSGVLASWMHEVPSRSRARLARMADLAAMALSAPPLRLAGLFALSLIAAAAWVAAALPLANDIGLNLPVASLVMVTVITEFSRLLPISVQGIGVREATFAVLTVEFGGNAADGFVVCAVLYLVNYLVVGLLGLAAALTRSRLDGPRLPGRVG